MGTDQKRVEKRGDDAVRWGGGFAGELKKTSCLAAPMVLATSSQYLLQVASVVMVGHLGQVSLAAVAIATSLTNLTGFSLLVSHHLFLLSFLFSLLFLINSSFSHSPINSSLLSSLDWPVDWKHYVGKLMELSNIKNLESILTVPPLLLLLFLSQSVSSGSSWTNYSFSLAKTL